MGAANVPLLGLKRRQFTHQDRGVTLLGVRGANLNIGKTGISVLRVSYEGTRSEEQDKNVNK